MSRVVIPLAYSARIFSSKPGTRRWCLPINCGSNVPSRSRGVAMVSSPRSPCTVFRRTAVAAVRRAFRRAPPAATAPVGGVSTGRLARRPPAAAFRPRWTSISVFEHPLQGGLHHQPHQPVEVLDRPWPGRQSRVLAAPLAICKEASMCQSPIQKKGYSSYPFLLADTRFLTGPVNSAFA